MTPHIYIEDLNINMEDIVLSYEKHHHIATVLRLKKADDVIVFDGNGNGYCAIINSTDKSNTSLKISPTLLLSKADEGKNTIIAQAVCAPQKMDWAVEKMTELGVNTIYPITTIKSRPQANEKRLERLTIAACEQCGRYALPSIKPTIALKKWLDSIPPLTAALLQTSNRYFLSCRTQLPLVQALMQSHATAAFYIVVGPESGFSEDEENLLTESGFIAVGLGMRTLRTETAALVALTLVNEFSNGV